MAHGFLSLTMDPSGDHQFYDTSARAKANLMLSAKTSVERLRLAVDDIGEYVARPMRLFERIYREKKLEPRAPEAV